MPNKSVDTAFAEFLNTSAEVTQSVYHERVPKGAKPEYVVVAQTGYELPDEYQLGTEGGLATVDCTIYARSPELADPVRRAVKKAARKYRGVQGGYHVTATRLTGDTAGGIDETAGVYTYTISVEIDYTEE